MSSTAADRPGCAESGRGSFQKTHVRQQGCANFIKHCDPPRSEEFTSITAPVYGFYAGNDNRIDATLPDTQAAMKKADKIYDSVTYEGAGHGFMRARKDPSNTVVANKKPVTRLGSAGCHC